MLLQHTDIYRSGQGASGEESSIVDDWLRVHGSIWVEITNRQSAALLALEVLSFEGLQLSFLAIAALSLKWRRLSALWDSSSQR